MSTKERQKMYKETQSSITKMLEKGKIVDKKLIENQLTLINKDVRSNDESLKKSALAMMEFLLNINCEHIQKEIIKELNDNADNKFIQSLFIKSIRHKISENIGKCQNFCEILLPWQDQETTMLINILQEVCLNIVPREKCKTFFMNQVVPLLMSIDTDDNVRNILSEIAFMLVMVVPITDLTSEELSLFLEDISNKYISAIINLRDKEYSNWHKLWIFLVRFLHKKLHNKMDLTNRLLRVVEFAFRSPSVQQRLRGYDCWKELIDNASLDINYICSSKQIKLLVTPLRAKFSKQEVVISKRFDVFTYLLEKLKHNAELCLKEFLEFCFGPVGDNKDESKTGQGKSVLEVRVKSTKVLIEVIGHSHGKNVDCVATDNIIHLEKPVINHNNFPIFHQFIINSIAQCSVILMETDVESKRTHGIKCMWISVFSFIVPPSEMRLKYFQLLGNILDNYIIQSIEKPYLDDLLGVIFTALVSFEKDSNHQFHECIQLILQQLIAIFFKIGNIPTAIAENFKKIVSHMFSQIMLKEEKIKMTERIMKCFSIVKSRDECASNVAKIWLCLVSEIITELTPEKIEEFVKFKEFFFWPAHNLHFLDDKAKKQIILNWMKLYKKLSIEADDKKLLTMKHLNTIFKNNPLLASDIICLLNVMSQVETKFSKEFVIKFMEVTSSILLLPNLQSEDEQKITSLIIQYLEPSLECYKPVDDERAIKVVCTNIEHILCIHEGFKLLEPLANFIRNCSKDIRSKFSKHLESLLLDLYTKENDTKSYNARELSKVLGVFSENDPKEDKKTFIIPSGRSARIANLAKSSPKTPTKCQKIAATASPTSLRLFGKDPETMSPLHARGSQLNNITPKRNKHTSSKTQIKVKTTPSINEEDSSDFIRIETEVNFQPSKLNEHQKEVMRKRREDIPALYQDLSQSLSQDIFSSKSNSKETLENEDKRESSNDNRKVIVEKVNSLIYSLSINEGLEPKDNQMSKSDADIMKNKSLTIREYEKETRAVEKIPKMNSESNLFSEDIKNLLFERVRSDEIISGSLEEKVMITKLPIDTVMTFKDFNTDSPPLCGEDLFSQISKGHEQNKKVQTEDTISADLFSEAGSSHDTKDIPEHEEKSNGKKKKKVEAELERLKMDIVGAEQFLETKRRTRPKEKPTKFDETLSDGKKVKKSPPEENVLGGRKKKTSPLEKNVNDIKINTSSSGKSRRSISLEKSEKAIEKNRRKTIGDMHDNDSDKKDYLLETSSLAISVLKKSTDVAKPLENKSSKQIVSLPKTPQPKSKERKTPTSKKKNSMVQDIKPSQTGHALTIIEQEISVCNKKKFLKLQKGSATEDEINSTPDPQKAHTAKKTPLKPEEDLEMIHEPEMDEDKEERRQKNVDKFFGGNDDQIIYEEEECTPKAKEQKFPATNQLTKLQNNEKTSSEVEEEHEVEEEKCMSNEKEIDFSKCTVKLQEGAEEKENQEHNTEKITPQIVEQSVELLEQLMVGNVEMPMAKDVEIQDPIRNREGRELHEMELISKQLTVNEIERGKLKEPVTEISNLRLSNDYPIESSGATFTIKQKNLDVLLKLESPTEIEVLNSGEKNLNQGESETSTINEETPDIFERRGEKRKHSTDDDDIIESSQESFAEVTSLNSSKKRPMKAIIEHNANGEKTMIQQKTVTPADFISDIKKSETNCIEIIEETEVYQQALPTYIEKDDREIETENICSKKFPEEELNEYIEEIPEKIDNTNGYSDKKIDDPNSLICPIPIEETDPSKEISFKCLELIEHSDDVELDTSKDVNTTQDTTLTQDSLQTEENVDQVATQDTMTQPTFTQETPTQQDLYAMSEDSAPPTLYFDLPKKPNLTESEQMMCKMDTMSICGIKDNELLVRNQTEDNHGVEEIESRNKIVTGSKEIKNVSLEDTSDSPSTCNTQFSSDSFSSPNRSNSLPSSPITVDTPTRTTKLLDDTMDISPIKCNSSPKKNTSREIPVASRLFFQDDFQELSDMEKLIKSATEADTVPWKNEEGIDDVNGGSTSSDDSDGTQNGLHTVPSVAVDIPNKNDDGGLEAEAQHNKVSSSYQNCVGEDDENAQTENENVSRNSFKDSSTIQERSSKLLNMINVNSPSPHNVFFKRRAGGSTSSPSGGRIRKLMSNFYQKQTVDFTEEINEDDILTFSREIPSPLAVPKSSILKRKLSDTDDGISPCAKRKRVNFSDPCLTSKKLFIKDDFHPSLEAKRLFDPVPDSKPNDNIKDIFDIPDDSSSDQLSETENIETEPSLDMLNPMILHKDRPIYPKLIDCKDDVLVILKRVTSPMFIITITNKLKNKNIRTVGELAQQSEAEINRFPFKVPVVANVYKALDNYYKKKRGVVNGESGADRKVSGIKESHKKEVAEVSSTDIPKLDIASEMRILIQRAVKEKYPLENLANIVIGSLDKQKVISLVKGLQSSICVTDFLEESDHNTVLKHISQRTSISDVLNRICDSLSTDGAEEFLDGIANYASSTVPLEKLLRGQNVEKLIEVGIQQNNSTEEEVINKYILPLIKNPSNISPYLKSLSMDDFVDFVTNRLDTENLGKFLRRMKELYPETFSKTVCDNCLVSPGDITTSFKSAIELFTGDQKKQMMIDIFRFISKNLDVNTLVNLHVEFLKTIPTSLRSQEK